VKPGFEQHPDLDTLQAFALGRPSGNGAAEIEAHLLTCLPCCATVNNTPEDPFGALVRTNCPPEPAETSLRLLAGYEILEVVGQGGMGIVYKARQPGLKRLVALKRLKVGADAGAADLARFRQEATAAGRLRHENIVRVYENGEQDGIPFIAFEYIEGKSLADILNGKPVPARIAAALTQKLAAATEHAHANHVLHRDLKPGNILLAYPEGFDRVHPQASQGKLDAEKKRGEEEASIAQPPLSELVPKISDFGLAKLLDLETGATRSGMLLGTPEYMAPEQAGGRIGQQSAATDVYALGAILYEMVTGRPPFRSNNPMETLQLVKDTEPVMPCYLQPNLPIDLNTICLKCLEKDAARRYTSAAALAADCRAFLEGRPIAARPISFVGRSWKLLKRRPLVSTLGTAACLLAITLVVVRIVDYFSISLANAQLQNALQTASQQKELAQRRYQTALRVVDELLAEAADLDLAGIPEAEEARKRLLKKALAECDALLEDRDNPDPLVQRALARIYRAAATVHDLLGEWPQAEANAKTALLVLDGLPPDMASELRVRRNRAEAHGILAHVYEIEKQLGKAEEAARQVVQIWEECPEPDRSRLELAKAYNTLGILYQHDSPAGAAGAFPIAADHRAQAGKMYEAIVALLEPAKDRVDGEDSILAGALINLGSLKFDLRAPPQEIEKLFVRAIALLEPLARKGSPRVAVHDSLAACYRNLGTLGSVNGAAAAQMEEYYRKGLSYREQLANYHSRISTYKHQVAFEHEALGGLYYAQANRPTPQLKSKDGRLLGRNELLDRAAVEFRTATEIRAPLVAAEPAGVNYVVRLADVYTNLGLVLGAAGKVEQAESAYRNAMKLMEPQVGAHPDGAVYAVSLSKALVCLGALRCDLGPPEKTKEGLAYLARAIDLAEGVLKHDPTNVSMHRLVIEYYSGRIMALHEQKQNAQAQRDLDRVIELRESQLRLDPLDRYAKTSLRDRYVERALIRVKQGSLRASYQDLSRAAAILRQG
jgi:serine/threonine protein kinase